MHAKGTMFIHVDGGPDEYYILTSLSQKENLETD